MFRQLLSSLALFFVVGFAWAGEAARVVFVTGQVQISSEPVVLGAAIQEGDEITTGADGYVYLKTIDDGFLILRPGSRARVVTYHVDTQNPANTRIKLELKHGVARAISGQAVKQARQNFRFNTPVAAIGVRGTDFTVFTDQQTSRVTVISGGVVVSPFAGGCGPEGVGPCEGGSSRELFADQTGQLLQVRKGQAAPQLLRSTGLSPDVTAPPRKDEPFGKDAGGVVSIAPVDVSFDARKSDSLLSGNIPVAPSQPSQPGQQPPTAETPPVVVPPPVVVVTPPSVPPMPEILWGRWESVANLTEDTAALEKLKNGEYLPSKVLGSFFITRAKDARFEMPSSGRASFALGSSEAYIMRAGMDPVAANVQNPRFDVDFGARTFSTSLTVVASVGQVDIRAQGDVSLSGDLYSDVIRSNARISGYLGGVGAREAGYLFLSTENPALTAFGGTRWSR